MNIITVIIAGVVLAVLVFVVMPHISWMRRRNRLRTRPKRPFDDWYAEFYEEEHYNKELIRDIHEVIGNEVGVDAAQVYPGDRFDVELRCPEWWGLRGHELEGLEDWVMECHRQRQKELSPGFPDIQTVEDLVNELEAALSDVSC